MMARAMAKVDGSAMLVRLMQGAECVIVELRADFGSGEAISTTAGVSTMTLRGEWLSQGVVAAGGDETNRSSSKSFGSKESAAD